MKKLMLLSSLLFCLAVWDVSAQTDSLPSARQRLSEIEALTVKPSKPRKRQDSGLFSARVLPRVAYGRHWVQGDLFKDAFGPSYGLSLGVLNGSIRPISWLCVTAGVDFEWNRYTLRKGSDYFDLDASGEVQIMSVQFLYDIADGGTAVSPRPEYTSSLQTWSLGIPLNLDFHFSAFGMDLAGLRIGGGLSFPFTRLGSVSTTWKSDGSDYTRRTRHARTESLLWYCRAELYAGSAGLFYQYTPRPVLPGTSLRYGTLGLSLNF